MRSMVDCEPKESSVEACFLVVGPSVHHRVLHGIWGAKRSSGKQSKKPLDLRQAEARIEGCNDVRE